VNRADEYLNAPDTKKLVDKFRDKLETTQKFEEVEAPFHLGGFFFVFKKGHTQEQYALYRTTDLAVPSTVVFDPNELDTRGFPPSTAPSSPPSSPLSSSSHIHSQVIVHGSWVCDDGMKLAYGFCPITKRSTTATTAGASENENDTVEDTEIYAKSTSHSSAAYPPSSSSTSSPPSPSHLAPFRKWAPRAMIIRVLDLQGGLVFGAEQQSRERQLSEQQSSNLQSRVSQSNEQQSHQQRSSDLQSNEQQSSEQHSSGKQAHEHYLSEQQQEEEDEEAIDELHVIGK
jgi:hypothetical protein